MKKILKPTLLIAVCVLAAGCSTRGQVGPETMQQATAPLTCTNKAECDAWWQRAQVWVTNHTTYKLQTVTDSIIQTAGPSGGRRALAYQITKTPNNNGSATIGFAAHCDNMFGCEPNPWKAGADFKQFVRIGSAPTGNGDQVTTSAVDHTAASGQPIARHHAATPRATRASHAAGKPGHADANATRVSQRAFGPAPHKTHQKALQAGRHATSGRDGDRAGITRALRMGVLEGKRE